MSGNRRSLYRCTPARCNPSDWAKWSVVEYHAPNSKANLSLALLTTSKTVWKEAGHVLYSQQLSFADTYALFTFLMKISNSAKASLREIRLRSCGAVPGVNIAAFSLLCGVESLRKLELNCLIHRQLGRHQNFARGILTLEDRAREVAKELYALLHFWLDSLMLHRKFGIDKVLDMLVISNENFGTYDSPGLGNRTDEELPAARARAREAMKAQLLWMMNTSL